MTASKRKLRDLHDYCQHAVGGSEALPDFFRLLRGWVGSEHGAFFAANDQGELVQGGYHEEPGHAELAAEFVQRTRQADLRHAPVAPSAKAVFQQAVPTEQLHFDTPAARESGFYQELIRHIDGRHILRVGVMDGGRPLGLLALVRGGAARSFQDAEIDQALQAAAPLARMLVRPAEAAPARTLLSEGYLVLSPDGRLLQLSAEGERLWRLAQNTCFLHDGAHDHVLAELCAELRWAGGCARRRLGNGWGEFELEVITLREAGGGSGVVHLRLRHWTLTRLQHLRHMRAAQLSSAQQRVCLAMLDDCSQSEIAERLGISLQTSISHIRDVYARLGISSRSELRKHFERPAVAV